MWFLLVVVRVSEYATLRSAHHLFPHYSAPGWSGQVATVDTGADVPNRRYFCHAALPAIAGLGSGRQSR